MGKQHVWPNTRDLHQEETLNHIRRFGHTHDALPLNSFECLQPVYIYKRKLYKFRATYQIQRGDTCTILHTEGSSTLRPCFDRLHSQLLGLLFSGWPSVASWRQRFRNVSRVPCFAGPMEVSLADTSNMFSSPSSICRTKCRARFITHLV